MAQHWKAAGEAESAVAAWQRAGERSKDQGAAIEAERHYTRALAVLATLPDGAARVSQELALQIQLFWVLHGIASPEKGRVNARIRELSARVDDTQQLVLMVGFSATQAGGEPLAAGALAEEVLAAARRDGSTFSLTWGRYMVGTSRYLVGDLPSARQHVTEALRFYREEDHRGWPSEPGTLAHAMLAFVLMQQGFPDLARIEIDRLLALTERLELSYQRALGYVSASASYSQLRDAEAVATNAERGFSPSPTRTSSPCTSGGATSITAGRSPCSGGPTRALPSSARGSPATLQGSGRVSGSIWASSSRRSSSRDW